MSVGDIHVLVYYDGDKAEDAFENMLSVVGAGSMASLLIWDSGKENALERSRDIFRLVDVRHFLANVIADGVKVVGLFMLSLAGM